MRPVPVYVVDLIQDVVTATNTAVIEELKAVNPLFTAINFIPGTLDEITDVLTVMSQQPADNQNITQWPLFALLMSFPEKKAQPGQGVKLGIGIDNTADLNIVIATVSNPTDRTPARMTNNIKPILFPIYLEFLNQLYYSTKFDTELPNNIPHEMIIFPYYNADQDKNIFNSYVDAIQIKIKLKIKLPNGQY
jgi:hypothetical protein